MDKGENSAKNEKSTKTLGVKIKEEPQEETIKVGIIVFTPFIVDFHLSGGSVPLLKRVATM